MITRKALRDMAIIWITFMALFVLFMTAVAHCDDNSLRYKRASVSLFIKHKNRKVPKDTRDEIAYHIVCMAEEADISYRVITAIVCVESHYDHNAVGPCGEIGLMQIYDDACLGIPIAKPFLYRIDYNIEVGVCKLVEKLIEVEWDMIKAIKRYNGAGPSAEKYKDKVLGVQFELSVFEIADKDAIRISGDGNG